MSQQHPRHTLVLIVLALGATLAPVSMDMLTPSLAGIATDLQANPRTIELFLYSFLIGYGVAPLLWGILSDGRGRRPVMFWGMFLYCATSFACALVEEPRVFTGLRFIQGLGAGAGATMARAVVRDLYGSAGTTRAMARMMSLMAVVPFFMPLLGGSIAQVFGWKACFLIMSAVGAISVSAYLFLVPESRPVSVEPLSLQQLSIRNILFDPVFAQHAICNMFSISTLVIFGANFAFVTANRFDLESSDNGLVLALFNGSIALGMQAVRHLMQRCSAHGSILIGAASCSAGWLSIAVIALSQGADLSLLAPGLILAGAGSGVIMALCAGAALTPFTSNTGTASAIYLLLQSVGSSAISLGLGLCVPKKLLPMAIAMGTLGGLAMLSKVLLSRCGTGKNKQLKPAG
ncbi:MAG: MFS transporter [Halioglobus sp.]|nr:MFS transporter [Halioglobus sp.]